MTRTDAPCGISGDVVPHGSDAAGPDWARANDHAWRYFELHAGQRISMFNFFVVFSGLIAAGLGATVKGPPALSVVGVLLGFLLTLLSFVFWKLDQRASFLVKHAEIAHVAIEMELLPDRARLFANEPAAGRTAGRRAGWSGMWTFGRSLRLAFAVIGVLGVGAAAFSGLRAAGVLGWDAGEPRSATGMTGSAADRIARPSAATPRPDVVGGDPSAARAPAEDSRS